MKMIKRKIDSSSITLENDSLQKQQSHKSGKSKKFTSNNANQEGADIDFLKFPSPTFNIHVHVPVLSSTDSKIYLPRIQPVIHLHFDEIAKRLEVSQNKQSEEFLYKSFQNLLSMTSPKFGDVKFYFKNKSKENIQEPEETNEIQCSSRNHCNDSQVNTCKDKEKFESSVSVNRTIDHKSNSDDVTPKEKDCEISLLSKNRDLKMKKAVVVLTDICKSKNWKNAVANAVRDSDSDLNKNKSSGDSQNQLENNVEKDEENAKERAVVAVAVNKSPFYHCSVKKENESCSSSPSYSLLHNSEDSYVSDNRVGSNCRNINVKSEEIITNTSGIEGSTVKDKSLTTLAEGCNFSEILNRFRIKYNPDIIDTAKSSKNCEFGDKFDNEGEYDCLNERYTENNSSGINDGSDLELHTELNEPTLDSDEKNVIKYASDEVECPSFLQEPKGNFNKKNEKSDCLSENKICYDQVIVEENKGNNFDISFKHCYNSDLESDKCKMTSEEVVKSETQVSMKKKFRTSYDVGNIDFHLHLIGKEMKRRSQGNPGGSKTHKTSKIRKKCETEAVKSDESSPKRMKRSNKSSEQKEQTSSPRQDYIPLKTSGSTRFAVAPSDTINPYSTHSAKNFKQKMLFGNRITRFTSSNQLRINKLKQQASRSASNK